MNVTNRKMFRPRTARNKLNQMGGIMASSPELMQTVQKFNVGGQVISPFMQDVYGAIAQPVADIYTSAPVTSIRDFLQTANEQSGVGQIQAENQRIAAERRAAEEQLRAQQAADAQRVQSIVPQMQRIQEYDAKMTEAATPTLRGPTAEDFRVSPKASDLMTGSILGDSMLPDDSKPTFGPDDLRVTPPETTETTEKPTKPEPPALDPQEIDRYGAEELAQKGNQAREQVLGFLQNPNVSETEKNNAVLEMGGYKDPQEGMTLEERAKANAAMYKRMFGEDPEGDKKIDGYNLAMTGFLIAAGDSPRALQNIAKGAAQGTKLFMDTAKQRKAREDKFKMLGIDKAIRDDETRKKVAIDTARTLQGYKFQYFMNQAKSAENRELLALRLNADAAQLTERLNAQERIAADKNASADARAEATQEAALLAAQIKSLDAVGGLAFARSGSDLDAFQEEVDNILNDPEELNKAMTISQMGRSSKGLLQGPTEGRLRSDITDRIATMDAGKQIYFDAQGNLNQAGINLYQNLLTMSQQGPGGQASPPQVQYKVGQEVVDGQGNRGRVTSVDQNGNVTGIEPIQ
jgi:transposase-like protein